MKLWLIRHPTPITEPGICYGRLDLEPEPGHLQAMVAALRARPAPLRLLTSPLQRCRRLAEALAGHGWPDPEVLDGLAEMDFGEWEGRRWDDIGREAVDGWARDVLRFAPPGGETVAALADRAHAALQGALAAVASGAPDAAGPGGPGPTLAVVTHAGVIRTLPQRLAGRPLAPFEGGRIDYGTVTTLVRDPEGWREIERNAAP